MFGDTFTKGANLGATGIDSQGRPTYGLTDQEKRAMREAQEKAAELAQRKRDRFEAANSAMQGILANVMYDAPRKQRLEGMAVDAVAAADYLLLELDKKVAE